MKRLAPFALTAALLAPLAGCAADASPDAVQEGEQVASKARITFKAEGFQVETSGTLRAGGTVVVHYEPARLPGCRGGLNDGRPAWTIGGYASFNGQTPKAFEATELTADGYDRQGKDVELRIPEGGDLALWFQVTSRFGCSEYDSQYGQNFHFAVEGPAPEADATLTFRANGEIEQSAPLVVGAKVAVRYEQERLTECRSSYNGYAAWAITGHARVAGGTEQSFSTARPLDASGQKRELVDGLVQLSEEGELELWFENTGRGCVGWDSEGGKNYRFAIGR